jgi:ATP-dependent DNA helicase RecG
MRKEEFALILEKGEGYKLEFKESFDKKIDKEMVAFANSSGGKIILGVADDNEIKGITLDNQLKSRIQDIARNCQPPIEISIDEYEGAAIITVKEGKDKPYSCASGFYLRVGPNSQKLGRDEIGDFFQAQGKTRFDEMANLKFHYETHFDPKKLDTFLHLANISKVLDYPEILINLGVAQKEGDKIIFNNTGILFFSKNLNDIYFHTAVTCALYKGTGKIDVLDRRDFNEDIVSNIDGAINFLKRYIPVRYEMTGESRRKEIPEIPYQALREAVINAVTHRDYFEKGSNVMVEMFDDRIEISNYGGLVKGLKPEDFGKRSVQRNPNIANLLNRIEYIEKMGTGINKMREFMKQAGLPPIEFEFSNFFTAVFKRPVLRGRRKKGILFLAAVVDYTAQSEHLGDVKTSRFNHYVERTMRELTKKYNGQFIKRIGDAVLIFWENEEQFMDFAWELRTLSKERKIDYDHFSADLNMVAHYGKFSFEFDNQNISDLFGAEGLKIFRMQKYAGKHDVIVTDFLLRMIKEEMKERNIKASSLGKVMLKGFNEETELFKLVFPENGEIHRLKVDTQKQVVRQMEREEVKKEEKIEIARKMKEKGTDTGFISEITGLSKEEIEKI